MTKNPSNISIFLFSDRSAGKQACLSFSKKWRHVFSIVFDGDSYIIFDFGKAGIVARQTKPASLPDLLRNLERIKHVHTIVVCEVKRKDCFPWWPWWARSCNEVSRYVTGINVGFTFNPRHLYKKLLKYDGKRNFKVLKRGSRKNGYVRWE